MSLGEVEGAAWYEGSQVIAFDINDAYVDYTVMHSPLDDREMTEVLFVAAKREEVDFKMRLIESSDLEPRIVNIDALVLLEALLLERDLPETVAVIDIGAASSSIGVTKLGSAPFVRDIEIAGDSFTDAISKSLGISKAEAEDTKLIERHCIPDVVRSIEGATHRLVAEVRRSLVYYQTREHGSTVDEIFLCGGCSLLPGLSESIEKSTGIPVRRWSPLERVHIDYKKFDCATIQRLAPSMSLTVALAMQEDTQ